MKRYINILMVALATMMTSCLTEDPRDQLYEEDIYNNANNIYINAVAVLYNYIGGSADSEGLQGTCRGIYDYNTLTTDEAMIRSRKVLSELAPQLRRPLSAPQIGYGYTYR